METNIFHQVLKRWCILRRLHLARQITSWLKISNDLRIEICLRKDCVTPSGFCPSWKLITSMSNRHFSSNLGIRNLAYIGINLQFSSLQAAIVAVYVLIYGTGGQALDVTTLVSDRNQFISWKSCSSVCFLKGLHNSCQVSITDAKENLCRMISQLISTQGSYSESLYFVFIWFSKCLKFSSGALRTSLIFLTLSLLLGRQFECHGLNEVRLGSTFMTGYTENHFSVTQARALKLHPPLGAKAF